MCASVNLGEVPAAPLFLITAAMDAVEFLSLLQLNTPVRDSSMRNDYFLLKTGSCICTRAFKHQERSNCVHAPLHPPPHVSAAVAPHLQGTLGGTDMLLHTERRRDECAFDSTSPHHRSLRRAPMRTLPPAAHGRAAEDRQCTRFYALCYHFHLCRSLRHPNQELERSAHTCATLLLTFLSSLRQDFAAASELT